jgi:predicted transposase/invertase (TIGR01784 family)
MLATEWTLEEALQVRWEEGQEEGIEKAKLEDARNALKAGFSMQQIEQITGIPADKLEKQLKRNTEKQ